MEENHQISKIDVVIPVYNGANFIIDALNSVISQTLKPQNIFVIDDGSTDNTEEVVKNYASSSTLPVTYIKKENGGPNSARNIGVQKSSADFLTFLDADDIWNRTKLEKQIALFKESTFPNLGLVYCDYCSVNEKGVLIEGAYHVEPSMSGKVFTQLLQKNVISGSASAVMIKRECFDSVGFFDEALRASEDWDMWLRIAEKYDIDFVKEVLVNIRFHDKNAQKDIKKMFRNELMFYIKWKSLLKEKKISLPNEWFKRITKRVIKRLPNLDFLFMAIKTLL